jgi:hypothetical protein
MFLWIVFFIFPRVASEEHSFVGQRERGPSPLEKSHGKMRSWGAGGNRKNELFDEILWLLEQYQKEMLGQASRPPRSSHSYFMVFVQRGAERMLLTLLQ